MVKITTRARVWHCIRSCVMTMQVAFVLDMTRQACHYRSQTIKDTIERFVL